MKKTSLIVFLCVLTVGLFVFSAACGPDCSSACNNFWDKCMADFMGDEGKSAFIDACESECEDSMDSDTADCIADAATCEDMNSCGWEYDY
jgi:hypothetical protein